ncbi:MAG: hypothetical protein KDB80_11700, partial [Planctomycetes bacterium]|nr:hypothetical protein [Planctomycetota bacterium]
MTVGIAGAAVYGAREVYRNRLAERSRADGLAAYVERDYETAMPLLSYAVTRDRNDLEVLRALADSRAHVPEPGNRHLQSAAAMYRAVLDRDSTDLGALEALVDVFGQLQYHV